MDARDNGDDETMKNNHDTSIDDAAALFDVESKEKRLRTTTTKDGAASYVRETTDGRAKMPCVECGARTRRRGLDGKPRCADHAFEGKSKGK
jgi:hypothetical protein